MSIFERGSLNNYDDEMNIKRNAIFKKLTQEGKVKKLKKIIKQFLKNQKSQMTLRKQGKVELVKSKMKS